MCYNNSMRFLRGLLAIVLALILMASTALALGSFAMSRAVSEDAVRQAITETDAVGQLTGNIIIQNTLNLGGEYGPEGHPQVGCHDGLFHGVYGQKSAESGLRDRTGGNRNRRIE